METPTRSDMHRTKPVEEQIRSVEAVNLSVRQAGLGVVIRTILVRVALCFKFPGTMTAIQINVSRQMDGITYSLTPSIRSLIKKLFPSSIPANTIFVAYDIKSDFESQRGEVSEHIYPALLGIASEDDLKKKLGEIEFVDSATGKVIHRAKP